MERLPSQWRMQRNDMRLAHQLIEGHISNAFGGCRLPEGVDSEHFHSKGERQANNAPPDPAGSGFLAAGAILAAAAGKLTGEKRGKKKGKDFVQTSDTYLPSHHEAV